MHDSKIVISEGKKTAMETTINYILINTREANKSDFFPYLPNDQIYTKIPRSTTYNLVEIMFYLSNNTFWVIVVLLIFNEIKYTPLE